MKLPALLCAVAFALSYPCFAAPRLPDYAVTEIGAPGAGQYVFCSPATCPEPTIKHAPEPVPQLAPEPALSRVPISEPAEASAPAPTHRSRARKRALKAVHHAHRTHSAPVLPRCPMPPSDGRQTKRVAGN
ncbi:hypothetical protein EFP18_00235 (plasmid) [Burkholderia glumae]|nr:hypothetical protein KS03_5710 [Burkholderia glumae LMG 2196 = ATCC 33617]PNL04097.1 hypothetical protein CEQ24_012100 [Burkholderia glumae]UVS82754.1 hypothetical protein EFP18_00235 [Burkholderia glumae]